MVAAQIRARVRVKAMARVRVRIKRTPQVYQSLCSTFPPGFNLELCTVHIILT